MFQVSYIIEEYRCGRTPNPDVLCNTRIKFGMLFKRCTFEHFKVIHILFFSLFKHTMFSRCIHGCHQQYAVWLCCFWTLCKYCSFIYGSNWWAICFRIVERHGIFMRYTSPSLWFLSVLSIFRMCSIFFFLLSLRLVYVSQVRMFLNDYSCLFLYIYTTFVIIVRILKSFNAA